METQLVRLDRPYNVICAKDGKLGLHIATLIVVKEEPQKNKERGGAEIVTAAHSYPVVGGTYDPEGGVWMESELKDCKVVCREGGTVGLYDLKRVMEFFSKNSYHSMLIVPTTFHVVLLLTNSKFKLHQDNNGQTISDYEVCLEFSAYNDGTQYMIYADNESEFFFYDSVVIEAIYPEQHGFKESIAYISKLRDKYLLAFRLEGLRSITFTTKDTSFQWYVDKLNNTKPDGAGV
jgi:hypothetical protein